MRNLFITIGLVFLLSGCAHMYESQARFEKSQAEAEKVFALYEQRAEQRLIEAREQDRRDAEERKKPKVNLAKKSSTKAQSAYWASYDIAANGYKRVRTTMSSQLGYSLSRESTPTIMDGIVDTVDRELLSLFKEKGMNGLTILQQRDIKSIQEELYERIDKKVNGLIEMQRIIDKVSKKEKVSIIETDDNDDDENTRSTYNQNVYKAFSN
jgi:hypothetical protein